MRAMLFRCSAACLIALFVLAGAAPAQQGAPASSHENAARELYRLAGGEKLAESGAEAMMGLIRDNPELAPYEDVFREWYRKVFASGDLESELVQIYMEAFTEAELREITAFYKTPVGQKALAAMPELMKKGAEIGMRRAQDHSAELEAMLTKAREERGKQKEPGS